MLQRGDKVIKQERKNAKIENGRWQRTTLTTRNTKLGIRNRFVPQLLYRFPFAEMGDFGNRLRAGADV